MGMLHTERRRTPDWVEYDVIDDAKNVWVERHDLEDGKVVNVVRLTQPRPKDAPEPKPASQFADKPQNPFVVRVPAGNRFAFGHNAEKALYRGLVLGGLAAGTAIGILNLIGQAVF